MPLASNTKERKTHHRKLASSKYKEKKERFSEIQLAKAPEAIRASRDRQRRQTSSVPTQLFFPRRHRDTQIPTAVSIKDVLPVLTTEGLVPLNKFAKDNSIPLVVAKYRYGKYPGHDDFIIQSDLDNRFYEYQGKLYNATEIAILTGIAYKSVRHYLRNGLSVSELMTRRMEGETHWQ